MSEKTVVVEGAICKCKFGKTPDNLKVLSHKKEYANNEKLIATTMELGATFQKNTFGSCSKQPFSPPCVISVLKWSGFYDQVILSNNGYILLEDSKATCPLGAPDCIEVIDPGQIGQPGKQNFKNADEEVHSQLNPLIDMDDMFLPEHTLKGVVINGKTI